MNSVEEAAKEHQSKFIFCNDIVLSVSDAYDNGMHDQSYDSFIAGAEWQKRKSPWKSPVRQPKLYSYILIFHDQMGTGYEPVFVDKEFLEKWDTLRYVLAWMYIPEPDVD